MDTTTQDQIDQIKRKAEEEKAQIDADTAAEIQKAADEATAKIQEQAKEEASNI